MDRRSMLAVGRSLVFALTLCGNLPSVAEAGPITYTWVTFELPFVYFDLEFGPDIGHARVIDNPMAEFDENLWAGTQEFHIVGGTFNLVTGALLDITPYEDGGAVYTHAGGGAISIQFDLLLDSGLIHQGTFEAPLGPYAIYAGGRGNDGSTTGFLGPGLFDRRTAGLLGIRRQTSFGNASLYLDTYDSYPDPFRVAQAFGYIDLQATVPEPSALWLIGMGGVALFYRRRRISGH